MIRRFVIAWKFAGIVKDLQFWGSAIPRLEAMSGSIPQTVDSLDAFVPKLTALESVLTRLDGLDGRLPQTNVLEGLNQKLAALDAVVGRIETLSAPVTVNVIAQKPAPRPSVQETDKEALERRAEWNRLKMLAKFCQLEGKAKEIEIEWQRIQQDEHDARFAFEALRGKSDSELIYLYKKGIADGIKWILARFA